MRHSRELRRDRGADVRVVVAVARRPPRRDAVDELAAVGEIQPHTVGTLDDERRRRGFHLPIRQPQMAQSRRTRVELSWHHYTVLQLQFADGGWIHDDQHEEDQLFQSLRRARARARGARRGHRLSHRPRLRRVRETAHRRRRPRHPRLEPDADGGDHQRAHRLRRRRARHRHRRHGAVLFRDVQPQARRRHHGHGEPQSAELQRHEVRARGVAPDQRRHGPARDPRARRARRVRPAGRRTRQGHASRHRSPSTSSICCRTST